MKMRPSPETSGLTHLPFLLALALLTAAMPLRAAVPRPEHPRPDAFRENWTSLNGEWQFEIDEKGDGEARGLTTGKDLAQRITVPFCPESKLSGIGHYGLMRHTWFRRAFEVPSAMSGKRVRLHFGAIDYQAWVWVNGQAVGSHIGGDVSFCFDITRFLKPGANEVVVHAFDDTPGGNQPTGKQTHTVSEGCVYTRTTGIWQPVWLEAVGASFVENFSVEPDPDHSRVVIEAAINGPGQNLTLTASAKAEGRAAGETSATVADGKARLTLVLNTKRLWEPGAPFLYDLKFALLDHGKAVDEVASYFGLRKVSIEGRGILINGKRVFQRLILDQGFYPDGVWTAPSDAELKADIERSMAAGYNGARLHQKVFEPRFLYWADKLGYLVWGEFPNWGFNYKRENYANVTNEWTEVVQRDRNHPALIGWCPFNETGAGEAGELQQIIWKQTKAMDPARPIIESSGYAHTVPNPEVLDAHDYDQSPQSFRQRWNDFFRSSPELLQIPARYGSASHARDAGRPFMVSEFGGTGWGDGNGGWGYGAGPKNLEEFYQRYEGLVGALLDNPDMFGFCYTQLTDVEQEHNGLYYYDRRPKFDLKRLHSITVRPAAFETKGPSAAAPAPGRERHWEVLVGAAADGPLSLPYHFTTQLPSADWLSETFNDSAWPTAPAPFGNALPGVRTSWTTGDIWLRRTFQAESAAVAAAALVIFHDEDTEVYVNGHKIWSRPGYITAYEAFSVTEELKGALKAGVNTLAVHTHQTSGGQFIDLAILRER